MKHNWEYKRLGDVCVVKSGYTPSSDKLHVCGEYPYFKVAEMNLPGNEKYLRYSSAFLKEDAKTFPANSIVFPKNGAAVATNKKRILFQDSVVDLNTAVMVVDTSMCVSFVFNFIQSIDFAKLVKRGTIPTLNIQSLKDTIIPVPPMEVQEQIVAELDKINELIAHNRELLRLLESLAQSLFYDTFGDPITNPKGWELHPFSDVFKLNSGDGLSAKQIIPGQYPVYGGNGIVGYHQNYNVDGNNVIIGRVGALCGNVRNVKNKAFVTDNAFIVTQLKALNQHYTTFMLNILNLRLYAKAVAQPVISNVGLKNILIQVPPLAMQEQFAAKVEAIEEQKAAVEKSIAELQTLLDSRMEYWFN